MGNRDYAKDTKVWKNLATNPKCTAFTEFTEYTEFTE